jgi:hypothetical protein
LPQNLIVKDICINALGHRPDATVDPALDARVATEARIGHLNPDPLGVEAVFDTGAVVINPDYISVVVDAESGGAMHPEGIVERGVGAIAVEEAAFNVVAVYVEPDDLAVVVDARGYGAIRAEGIVECGIGAVAVEKTALDVVTIEESGKHFDLIIKIKSNLTMTRG